MAEHLTLLQWCTCVRGTTQLHNNSKRGGTQMQVRNCSLTRPHLLSFSLSAFSHFLRFLLLFSCFSLPLFCLPDSPSPFLATRCLSTSHSLLHRSLTTQSLDSASLSLFSLSILAFSSLLLPRALSFSAIPPSTFCLAFLFSLLYCHLYFSPSFLSSSSSSSLLHHKVDGWMIHLSLCPRTVVILILLHS